MKPLIALFISCTLVITLSTGSSLANQHTVDPVSHAQSSPLQIDTLQMVNVKDGWALGQPEHSVNGLELVLHTTDGGHHWLNVTPAHVIATKYALCTGYVTQDTIGLVEISPGKFIRSYRTTDGGRTWTTGQSTAAQYGDGILQAQFVDKTHGFVEDSSAGNATLPGELFSTTDGGATWNRVATTNWMSKSVQHNLPFAGEIAFTNQKEGWLVGGERAAQPGGIGGPGFVWLYGTTDGGVVWRHQRIPVPSKYRTAITFVSPPAFAGSTVFVPVTYLIPGETGQQTVIYKSTDDGTTWSTAASPSGSVNALGFLNAKLGYLFMTSGKSYWTLDGGRTWIAASQTPNPSNFVLEGFINRSDGWAEWVGNHTTLIQTTNGGRTWTQVNPLYEP